MENEFKAEDARLNFGTKGCIDDVLTDIKRISAFNDHANVVGGPLTENQKSKLFKLKYKVKDCNFFQRFFQNKYNTIHW